MTTLYLKLKNGCDLIANTNIKNNGIATIENPVCLQQYQDTSGGIGLSFMEWIPSAVVDDSTFELSMDEVLITSNISSSMKEYYHKFMDNIESKNKLSNDEIDSYQRLLNAIASNKKLLH